jgi:membrane-associated phospholipid phosphatase
LLLIAPAKLNKIKALNKETDKNTWLIPARPITFILIVLALLLFIGIVWSVFVHEAFFVDQNLFSILSLYITGSRTYFIKAVTFLGNHKFLILANLLLITYFLIKKEKLFALQVTAIALSSYAFMSLLKNLFQRYRPKNPLVDGVTNFSFPSGHAFMSVTFYGLLIWLAAIYITNKRMQQLVIAFLLLLILFIGFSRIYLRMHYTTDVIAGYCMGFIWLMFCLWLTDKNQKKKIITP